ncbi:MAG: NAD 5'-nucleotidase [Paracidovorax wautersii]|uniref:NAD 5'-nucleotidase n=1 Tax=Paracidovorax wautersii TaxID=1177982 RepID=A0A7V8JS04_9BURK|nr:MAG: NAD 5'-nucleotidase [Paracidovorax wautersii]
MLAGAALAACGGDDDNNNGGGTPTTPPAAQALELTLLHINDHHSNLDAKSKTLQLRNAAGERVAVSVDAAGFARVTQAFEDLAASSSNVIKIHAGDALSGTLYYSRAGAIGEADAALMNTVCFDAFTLGNHEFDKGDTELKQWIDRLHAGACQTPVLSANVQFGANSALNSSRAPGYVQPATVIERGGQKIGLVGLTIAGKTKESSSPDPDTTFEDETVAAQRAIDALRAQGINKIVLQSHIGYEYDKQVLAKLSGVDVVIGGDSHTLLGPDTLATYGVGTPGGGYAQALRNKDGETVCIAQAWEYAHVVGELKVRFDAEGRVTQCAGTPHVLIGDNFQIGGKAVSTADRVAIEADVAASGFLRVTAENARAVEVLAPYTAQVADYRAKVVAHAPLELCARRVPGGVGSVDYSRSSADCNAEGSVSVRGGDVQQLVAQAYLAVANTSYGGADISLQSGGGVRVPLKGQVTAANVIEVLPFANMLWMMSITGAEARGMVEDGLDAVFKTGGTTGPYPYTGGLRFDVDASQAKGARASHFEVFEPASQTWVALDEAKTYRLAVLSFNATGGDGYTTLAQVPAARRLDVGVLDADVFQAYIDGLATGTGGVPAIQRLDHTLYSTKSFIGPAATR